MAGQSAVRQNTTLFHLTDVHYLILFFSLLLLEMCPQWFNHDSIPYDQMWVDDKLWYPLLLQGKRFNAFFKFQRLHKVKDYRTV